MTVYYLADTEKPKNVENIKFYTDHASALSASLESRTSVFSFDVNDKCDTSSFGLDTIMVFMKNIETGELKFLASGRWLELHELLNIPFYYDFEKNSSRFVSMSLQYFNKNYQVIPRPEPEYIEVEESSENNLSVSGIDENVLEELFVDSSVVSNSESDTELSKILFKE